MARHGATQVKMFAQEHLKLLVLVAVRSTSGIVDEVMQRWVERENGHHLEIGALGSEQSTELIRSLVSRQLPSAVQDYVAQTCDGVP